jgi:peptidoglycan hydrolase CwlO-like protein
MPDKKEKESQVVVINDVEYKVDDLTEQQVMLVNHVADLDRKLASSQFNLDQLQGGREFFMKKLELELEEDEEVATVESD